MKSGFRPGSTVQTAGAVTVWGMFSWHTLGPLPLSEHDLKAESSVADHVHGFLTHLLGDTEWVS